MADTAPSEFTSADESERVDLLLKRGNAAPTIINTKDAYGNIVSVDRREGNGPKLTQEEEKRLDELNKKHGAWLQYQYEQREKEMMKPLNELHELEAKRLDVAKKILALCTPLPPRDEAGQAELAKLKEEHDRLEDEVLEKRRTMEEEDIQSEIHVGKPLGSRERPEEFLGQ